MKVYISFKLQSNGSGGNNFLKYLFNAFSEYSFQALNARQADIILINSHHKIIKNLIYKMIFPSKIFIHRIDGKLSLHRNLKLWDSLVILQNKYIADFSIFQSNWSKEIWSNDISTKKSCVILNSVDANIFKQKKIKKISSPVKIVFSSWSSNKNKGITLAKELQKYAQELNFQILHTGIKLVSIDEWLQSPSYTDQKNIAAQLKRCDIFFSPTMNESCSNSILEAMAVGLPVLALNSGGNRQVISGAGELFNEPEELIRKLKIMIRNYDQYKMKLHKVNLKNDATKQYLTLMHELFNSKKIRKLNLLRSISLIPVLCYAIFLKLALKLATILSKYPQNRMHIK
jgi:glycosyltransferase involved in cell wall biosynthesis